MQLNPEDVEMVAQDSTKFVEPANIEMAVPATDAPPKVTEPAESKTETTPPTEESKEPASTWVPPEKRRPDDEYFDLKSIVVVRTSDVQNDGSIIKLVIQEGVGAFVDPEDIVYYRHETRFDNG